MALMVAFARLKALPTGVVTGVSVCCRSGFTLTGVCKAKALPTDAMSGGAVL